MSTLAIPPLPSGYSLDTQNAPTLPQGYSLDNPQSQSAEYGTLTNAPTGVHAYFQNLESDLRYGTGHTAIGKILNKMGAQGINVGAQAGAGDTLESPILGPIHTAQGLTDTAHPVKGAVKALGGVLETATLPAAFIAPEASPARQEVSQAAKNGWGMFDNLVGKTAQSVGIPTKSHARQLFQEAMSQAKDTPITLDNTQQAALKLMDWQKKTTLGPTVNKFLNRITNPRLGPMTYEESRDFYQLLGKLSADESSKMPAAVRADLTQMVKGLGQDISNAASGAGVGPEHQAAMKEYAQASKAAEALQDSWNYIQAQIAQKAPWLVFGYAGKKLYDSTK